MQDVAILALVVVSAFLVLRGPAADQRFSIDESRWIATSRYFWITFIERDLFGLDWRPNYLVYTHPPVARYLIGFGLWLQGWSPEQLNGRYDSLRSRDYNDRMGNIPDPDLLWAARRVTLVFAVAAVTLIYIVGRILGGPLAGLAAAGFALVSPLLTTVWTRALAESIVATFTLLTLALALRVMPYVGNLGDKAWVPLAVGTSLALAAATKLNGAIGAIGLVVFAVIQQAFACIRTRRTLGLRSWLDVMLGATILFVAVNPLLYQRPGERIVALIQHRRDEMAYQRTVFSAQAVPEGLSARIAHVARRTFDTHATPPGPLPLSVDVVLVAAGLLILAARSIAELRRAREGPVLLFLCWFAATYGVITPNLGYDSSHYIAPLVTLNVLVIGVAIETAVRMAGRFASRIRARPGQAPDQPDQKVQAPTT